jgi:hypothetical protein
MITTIRTGDCNDLTRYPEIDRYRQPYSYRAVCISISPRRPPQTPPGALLDTLATAGHMRVQRTSYGHLCPLKIEVSSPGGVPLSKEVDTRWEVMTALPSKGRRRGRPLRNPALSFAARLFAELEQVTEAHAADVLAKDPDRASGSIWALAAEARSDGCTTLADFERWLGPALQRRIANSFK